MSSLHNKKTIYILPVGFDIPRILKFPHDRPPTECYLITQKQDKSIKDDGREYVLQVYNHLVQIRVPTAVIGCSNFFDIVEIMACYRWIAEKHLEDQVFINVSGGSKLSAMAGMVISGIYDHVSCFYSRVSVKNGLVDSPIEFKETFMLPKFRIEPPKEEHVHLLNFFVDEKLYAKKDMLQFSIDSGLIRPNFQPQGSSNLKKRSQQALFNALKRNFIGPMIERDLIIESTTGQLYITNRGLQIKKIFENSHSKSEEFIE